MPKLRGRLALPENIKIVAKRADGTPIPGWQPSAKGLAYYRRTGKLLFKEGYGEWKDEVEISNLIVNAGLAIAAKRIFGITATAFSHMALGTDNTAADVTDTALGAEITTDGLGRASVTPTSTTTTVTDDTAQMQHTFTATGSQTVQEFGIFNASSGGTMFTRRVVGPYALANGDTIQFTYKLDVSA